MVKVFGPHLQRRDGIIGDQLMNAKGGVRTHAKKKLGVVMSEGREVKG